MVNTNLKMCLLFECNICWVDFEEKYFLKQHVLSVHEGNQYAICDICSANFKKLVHVFGCSVNYFHPVNHSSKFYK